MIENALYYLVIAKVGTGPIYTQNTNGLLHYNPTDCGCIQCKLYQTFLM
jgi:hypothetical protein